MSRQNPGTWAENLIVLKKELRPGYTKKTLLWNTKKNFVGFFPTEKKIV